MRLNEFANAQAQLDLLRIIIDNTWSAIAQQAEEQKRVEAERKAQAKLKPKSKKTSKASITRIPAKASVPNKKPEGNLMKLQPPAVDKPDPNSSNAVKPLRLMNPQLKQPPTNTAINSKPASTALKKPIATTPIKPQADVEIGYFGNNIDTTEKEEFGDDRDSKKGITTTKE